MQDKTVYSTRARLLDRFVDLARRAMRDTPRLASVRLDCAEYWNDEASDAVHYRLTGAPDLIPLDDRDGVVGEPWEWSECNSEAVWAFGAMCVEEGYDQATGQIDNDLKDMYRAVSAPLAIAQRDGDWMRVHWLGGIHRPWLDHPASFRERTYRGIPAEPEPRRLALAGDEHDLVSQLLDGDDGALEVLRDAWALRGDPRGEFCALAHLQPLPARVADLVAEYGRSWLGPLDAVIVQSGALFGPGPFVRKAIVHADHDQFKAIADAAEWGSIEELEFAPGSYRGLSPRMHRLRAVGPIGPRELAKLPTTIEQLDYLVEGYADIDALIAATLPLHTLRLHGRVFTAAKLKTAPWWSTLRRLELWCPRLPVAEVPDLIREFDDMAAQLPRDLTFGVGVLDDGVRSGWLLVTGGGERSLELVRSDARDELERALASESGLPRIPRLLDGDHWLDFALGVQSTVPLR